MLILQLALTVSSYPYYLTYYNPLLGGIRKAQEVMTVGWGEGLNEAARYLKDQPDISKKIIYSWYPLVFNWYSANLGFQAQVDRYRRPAQPGADARLPDRRLPGGLCQRMAAEHTAGAVRGAGQARTGAHDHSRWGGVRPHLPPERVG